MRDRVFVAGPRRHLSYLSGSCRHYWPPRWCSSCGALPWTLRSFVCTSVIAALPIAFIWSTHVCCRVRSAPCLGHDRVTGSDVYRSCRCRAERGAPIHPLLYWSVPHCGPDNASRADASSPLPGNRIHARHRPRRPSIQTQLRSQSQRARAKQFSSRMINWINSRVSS
jgi:hypothetical protein